MCVKWYWFTVALSKWILDFSFYTYTVLVYSITNRKNTINLFFFSFKAGTGIYFYMKLQNICMWDNHHYIAPQHSYDSTTKMQANISLLCCCCNAIRCMYDIIPSFIGYSYFKKLLLALVKLQKRTKNNNKAVIGFAEHNTRAVAHRFWPTRTLPISLVRKKRLQH